MRVMCLFCNKNCSRALDYCHSCKASYNLTRERAFRPGNIIVSSFNILICNNKFIVHYYIEKGFCAINYLGDYSKSEIVLPINKLLLLLPELEEKVNNLMAYL